MLNNLLQPEVKAFIKKHEQSDLNRLLLNKKKYPQIPLDLVVDQIRAREKAKRKLPLWYNTAGIVMPPLVSMEQSSSEEAAAYKSKNFGGDLVIDLTGGAGVDAYYFSKRFKRVIYIDINKDLADIAKHNFGVLGANNIEVLNTNSEDYISSFNNTAELIYIDPARRDQNQKLFLLEDCVPNIVSLQTPLLQKAKTILVKASPMLDITKALNQLRRVSDVHVVAIKNEVKELLFIQSETTLPITITAIDLMYNAPFVTNWEHNERAKISSVFAYLYEPNAAILKTGKADMLALQYGLCKLNTNTQLFTSNKLEGKYPGRMFKVKEILKYDKKELRKRAPSLKANISVRNFPDSVDQIRKKTGIKSGGDIYLFAIRDSENKPRVLVCDKI
jgi:16S rRNA G966 N2-methylase RsmD